MAIRAEVKTGFADLDRKLAELENSVLGGELVEQSMLAAAQPMADLAQAKAKRRTGRIAESLRVGTPRSDVSPQRRRRLPKDTVVVVGASAPDAHLLERGSYKDAPQPFIRPAFEEDKDELFQRFAAELRRRLAE